MRHELFGELAYDADESAWRAHLPLSRLVAYGVRAKSAAGPEPGSPEEQAQLEQLAADANRALDLMKGRLRDRLGPEVDRLFEAMDEEAARLEAGDPGDADEDEEPLIEPEAEAALDRAQAVADADERERGAGLFPVVIADPKRSGPSPEQEAAFRHLRAHEAEVARAVLGALYESYRDSYADERWRRICDLPEIDTPEGLNAAAHLLNVGVAREHKGGTSFLVFTVECDWEVEHGMLVVYHPDDGATWTTYDGLYDLLESGEGGDEEDDAYEPPGNYELVTAVMNGDEERVRRLVAEGHDINDVGDDDPFPPLSLAVSQMDVDAVRRLLALGADPNLKDGEGKTALRRARRQLKDITPREGDKLMQIGMSLARMVNPSGYKDVKSRMEEIIRLLEEAGAR